MTARRLWLLGCLALLGLPACLDPIVGAECKPGYSPCHGTCVIAGRCQALDAGGEAGIALDGGIDSDDWDGGAVLDADESEAAAAIDGAGIDVGVLDVGRGDGRADSNSNGDVAVEPARDGGSDGARDLVSDSARDVASEGNRDTASEGNRDTAGDSPRDAGAADVPLSNGGDAAADDGGDAPPLLAVDARDGARDGDCPGCSDGHTADAETAPMVVLDGATGDGTTDESVGDGAAPADASAPLDTGPMVCPNPQIVCDNQCIDPRSDPNNCGGCNIGCQTGVCNGGNCLVCATGQIVCSRQCVSIATDPDNCGGCGVPCASGLCSNGICEAAGTGRAIVIGHDYFHNRPAMNRILGNAVFLWPVNPVQLLVYEGAANPTAIAGANAAISQVATSTGRQVVRTSVVAAAVPATLATSDVFLVYGQETASDATLNQLGLDWKAALTTFVQNGGTVIVLDAVYDGNAGTSQILAQAGLFGVARGTSATNDVCTVITPGDALAVGLPKTYLCEVNSTGIVITDTASTVTSVVDDGTRPVVVHKVF